MLLKKVFLILSMLFPVSLYAIPYEAVDALAYKSGELVAELTVAAWLCTVKHETDSLLKLLNKIAHVGEDYTNPPARSFVLGYATGLDAIDIDGRIKNAHLDIYRSALIFTVYYYWLGQLSYALEANEFAPQEKFLDNALHAAMMVTYGEIVPEVMQQIKNTINEGTYSFVAPYERIVLNCMM